MRVRNTQEAVYIACKMEQAAVQLYERALEMLTSQGREKEALFAHLTFMMRDEQHHLRQFSALFTGLDDVTERLLLLAAESECILFKGGLMGAARGGMLKDVPSMLRFAAESEETAAETYRDFAEDCEDAGAAEMLRMIAEEEDKHLFAIRMQQRAGRRRQK